MRASSHALSRAGSLVIGRVVRVRVWLKWLKWLRWVDSAPHHHPGHIVMMTTSPTRQAGRQAGSEHRDAPPPGDLLADGVAHHLVEVGHAVPGQVVELAPEQLAQKGDGRLGVLALELRVHLFFFWGGGLGEGGEEMPRDRCM